jgi:hypothetical protein
VRPKRKVGMEGTGGALRDLGDGVSCVHVISLNVTNTLLVPALLLLPLQKRTLSVQECLCVVPCRLGMVPWRWGGEGCTPQGWDV